MSKAAKPPVARKNKVKSSEATPRRNGKRAAEPKAYHHGDLRRVLIAAALELAEEGGSDAVSVREAARRAGVSPGAPFRHFPSRDALMSAVAEEAQRRFRIWIAKAIADSPVDDPLARFRAFGTAYLRWAMQNPAHFEVISSARYFVHDQSATVSKDNDELIDMTEQLLADAAARGQLRFTDIQAMKIAGGAMVYGFACMKIDGHFPRWGVADQDAEQMAETIISIFVDSLRRS